MATADTVELGAPHEPKEESIKLFNEILPDLKKEVVHARRDRDKHEPEYFDAVKHLSDKELVGFSSDDFTSVRVAISAYGIHLFGKVRIPAMADSDQKYIHFRAFTTVGEPPKLHSIHTEEKVEADGNRRYRAIFTEDDPLEWFDT